MQVFRRVLEFVVALLAAIVLYSSPTEAKVLSNTAIVDGKGRIRFTYDASVDDQCTSVLLLGVGTVMGIGSYDSQASDIVSGKSVVAVFVDHAWMWPFKTNSKRYATVVDKVAENLSDLIPICKAPPKDGFFIGGHSASGQAAYGALSLIKNLTPTGFIGLSPFKMTKKMSIDIPALFWGFSKTTCAVTVTQAAQKGYEISDDSKRVFYQVDNSKGTPKHCMFTNSGCTVVCPASKKYVDIQKTVGGSVEPFITAANSGSFPKEYFEEVLDNLTVANVTVYVNKDEV
mmetsp:Transcript_29101/g.40917  ORF Transcript_29101/g.40917 Transcript_29101/m.40917 type:complete len:287 (-) Transcript_29101:3777-4637(-)